MTRHLFLFLALTVTASPLIAAETEHTKHTLLEEVVVSLPFSQTEAETTMPVSVLSDEVLKERVASDLGTSLQNEIGLANASFGVGVGQPIIRGQTAGRVKVLQNSVGVTDAASISPDHANSVDTLLAERLEIIRGPATLLYGSGAIGGVVNVIDGLIPQSTVDRTNLTVEHRHNSVSDGNSSIVKITGGKNNFVFNLQGLYLDDKNVDIPGFAIDEMSLEELEELAESLEDHDDEHEHDEEEEELTNTRGFIDNSDRKSDSYAGGFSWVSDRGFIGVSVSRSTSDYGLPPGVHSHGHEDEHHDEHGDEDDHDDEHGDEDDHDDEHGDEDDHDDEHGDEDDHDDEHGDEDDHDDEHGDEDEHDDGHGHEEDVEFVRLDMERTRYDVEGEYRFSGNLINRIRGRVSFTDYEHSEIEIFEDGMAEVGTHFDNEGTNGRFVLDFVPWGNWSGLVGLQFSQTEFSAIGEEAYIPETDESTLGLFALAQYAGKSFTTEFGLRAERYDSEISGSCDTNDTAFSASASLVYDLNESTNLMFGLARSERGPGIEELYSNISSVTCAALDEDDQVLHAATDLIEVGNPDLDAETSNNIEIGLRRYRGPFTGELNIYYNEVDDYIFLNVDADGDAAAYISRDARFTGIEGRVTVDVWERPGSQFSFTLFADQVRARFDSGGDLPRITPAKLGVTFNLSGSNWGAHLQWARIQRQDRVGQFELETPGYHRASLYLDRHWQLARGSELTLFARASNLLDEEIRNHASLLKNYAPEPGRNLQLGIRFNY